MYSGRSFLFYPDDTCLLWLSIYKFYAMSKTNSCAVNILINIAKGYTVEYPTAGASLLAVWLAYANAGGSVYVPAIIPIRVK